ncbi:hypothetical protein Dsin_032147 [Dipteronia sinensis]|uniref:RNase H type-1 domain-containing protein n=1 Tax=Dipteronia sinensis TaxID=43782 RepID=A0AAE0DSS9_9ROSI|nr:hypothetical protein Dsin_032147 [Dipteronia sinensis]
MNVAHRIVKLQRSFLWGDRAVKRKMHGVKWEEVCKSEANDGLEVGRILDKNKAMYAKWLWSGMSSVGSFRRGLEESRIDESSIFKDWFKHLKKGSAEPATSLLLNFKELCVKWTKAKPNKILDWIPPNVESLKFNVDASLRGNLGPAGIGGVLRDSRGSVLCMFSQSVGNCDSNSAEFWLSKGLWSCAFLSLIFLIWTWLYLMKMSMKVTVVHDSKAFNDFADNLAKQGSSMDSDFLHWGCLLIVVGWLL